MPQHDPEVERLRDQVSCATLLERAHPPWRLDRRESTPHALKYRREKGEILIISHKGRGWWDPQSDAKGDVFNLAQHLDPRLNFGEVRKFLRPFAGVEPTFQAFAARGQDLPRAASIPRRWEKRRPLQHGSSAWRYLAEVRRLPADVLEAARAADILREGHYGSAWFAHRDATSAVTHVEIRGADYKGSLRGGRKSLFQLHAGTPPFARFVLAEAPIDALSLAALEAAAPRSPPSGALFAATGGGMGPATIRAIEHILAALRTVPEAIFCSAADANLAGDRHAARHKELALRAGVRFERLRPPIEGGDWNDVLRRRSERTAS